MAATVRSGVNDQLAGNGLVEVSEFTGAADADIVATFLGWPPVSFECVSQVVGRDFG